MLLTQILNILILFRSLPRDFTKVTIRTGMSYKRNSSSLVLLSLFLRFTSKVTNTITLIYRLLMGYSRKNPHPPPPPTDGTLEILAGGGVEGSGNPGRRGGLDLKNLLRGPFSP